MTSVSLWGVSHAWMWFKKCKTYSEKYPGNPVFVHLTMKAYADLLIIQALYFREIAA